MHFRILFVSIFSLILIISLSCRKSGMANLTMFYGVWKTSYGDTIMFTRENGKNILTFDNSMNPSMPNTTKTEFNYSNNKLGLKYFSPNGDFRRLESFAWVQLGHEFTVQGIEWFMFMSSTLTYFTFTRIS